MRNIVAALLVTSILVSFPVLGDEIYQTCEIVGPPNLPEKFQDLVRRLEPAAIRVCTQTDLNTRTYAALSKANRLSAAVCHYVSTSLSDRRLNGRTEYMALAGLKCPSPDSALYVAVDSVSPSDFVQIMDIVRQMPTAGDNAIFRWVPQPRLTSPAFRAFKAFLNSATTAVPLRISRYPGFFGICSNFDVLLGSANRRPVRLYTVKIQKCITGGLRIVDVEPEYS